MTKCVIPVLCGFLAVWTSTQAASNSTKPNLANLHTNEHDYRTLGCSRALMPREQADIWGDGVAVRTTHLEALTEHGTICERFYAVSPVCIPSWASFLTGRYHQKVGAPISDMPKEFIEAALGDRLRSFCAVIETARSQLEMSLANAKRYLSRLKEAGLVCHQQVATE